MQQVYLNSKLVLQKQRNNPTVYTPLNLLYFGRYIGILMASQREGESTVNDLLWYVTDSDQDFGFNGQLDGIRIWNRAWDAAEVAQNYNSPVSYPPGNHSTVASTLSDVASSDVNPLHPRYAQLIGGVGLQSREWPHCQ